ncbi:conserved hypothetical protein [Pediculus humanus corporis]|uniref:Phospholipid/glycerol acyltransferase domain-containing protein n=1 Tax=Pediculus humanus subsp. corporis TaxID=121224 RepID=E0VSI7_PEDHC|nr:uncharacterized protein Phum_PHUM419710 [Pediculus humanus corporis]EEB16343.1 conserved hypothetical protein [Pediculus humanus corporis]
MAFWFNLMSVSFSLLYTPFLMFLLGTIFLASMGKSFGVRRLYIKILIKIFEYGKQHIEIAQKVKEGSREGSDNEEEEDDRGGGEVGKMNTHSDPVGKTRSSVISRENLILVPDPELNYTGNNNLHIQNISNNHLNCEKLPINSNKVTTDSQDLQPPKREFELSDCLDYIRTGVEAIIEDQVTSRFEAEELKSWNLLTRTNHNYEFISWRLTVIWMFGFLMRYTFLLPLRVTICFFGVVWLILSTLIIGYLPNTIFKLWLTKRATLIAFRILMRSLSAVIKFHDKQYRPINGGICVANHTTIVDVAILSTDVMYSLTLWLTLCTAIVGYFPEGELKRWLNRHVSIMCFGVLSSALSSVITYHNEENRPKNGICVANHTSPIDVLVLACDNCYALIGQRHGGFLGILQRALARASSHIWFERSEVKDRHAVAKRLREHVFDETKPPILIFPEGTCINNTSVMQFKKGSFEVGGTVYPVAIKYDPRFGDAFWNSSKYSMLQYLYCMMTSWAIVCDVWYLPPMQQKPGESSIDFANRVKRAISERGGLVDLMWDGQLKRSAVKKEWKEKQQEEFSKRLKVE